MKEKIFEYQGLYYINEKEINDLKVINNKLYYKDYCDKCGGTGHISYYDWYANGVCFKCNGAGYKYRPFTTYKTLKGVERAKQRKIQKQLKYEKELEIKKQQVIEELKTIYVVNPKENTKQLKGYLKDIGCVWSGKVWYKNNTKEFENIQIIKIDITKELENLLYTLVDINSTKGRLTYISNIINEKIQPIINKLESIKYNTNLDNYNINEKYTFNITEVLSKKCYQSMWGACYYYILLDDNNHKLKYKTGRNLDISGKYTATIKDKEDELLIVTRLTQIK